MPNLREQLDQELKRVHGDDWESYRRPAYDYMLGKGYTEADGFDMPTLPQPEVGPPEDPHRVLTQQYNQTWLDMQRSFEEGGVGIIRSSVLQYGRDLPEDYRPENNPDHPVWGFHEERRERALDEWSNADADRMYRRSYEYGDWGGMLTPVEIAEDMGFDAREDPALAMEAWTRHRGARAVLMARSLARRSLDGSIDPVNPNDDVLREFTDEWKSIPEEGRKKLIEAVLPEEKEAARQQELQMTAEGGYLAGQRRAAENIEGGTANFIANSLAAGVLAGGSGLVDLMHLGAEQVARAVGADEVAEELALQQVYRSSYWQGVSDQVGSRSWWGEQAMGATRSAYQFAVASAIMPGGSKTAKMLKEPVASFLLSMPDNVVQARLGGKTGWEVAQDAVTMSGIEGAITLAFSAFGAEGIGRYMSGGEAEQLRGGMARMLATMAKDQFWEVTEELSVNAGQLAYQAYKGEIDPDEAFHLFADSSPETVVQTLMATSMFQAVSMGRLSAESLLNERQVRAQFKTMSAKYDRVLSEIDAAVKSDRLTPIEAMARIHDILTKDPDFDMDDPVSVQAAGRIEGEKASQYEDDYEAYETPEWDDGESDLPGDMLVDKEEGDSISYRGRRLTLDSHDDEAGEWVAKDEDGNTVRIPDMEIRQVGDDMTARVPSRADPAQAEPLSPKAERRLLVRASNAQQSEDAEAINMSLAELLDARRSLALKRRQLWQRARIENRPEQAEQAQEQLAEMDRRGNRLAAQIDVLLEMSSRAAGMESEAGTGTEAASAGPQTDVATLGEGDVVSGGSAGQGTYTLTRRVDTGEDGVRGWIAEDADGRMTFLEDGSKVSDVNPDTETKEDEDADDISEPDQEEAATDVPEPPREEEPAKPRLSEVASRATEIQRVRQAIRNEIGVDGAADLLLQKDAASAEIVPPDTAAQRTAAEIGDALGVKVRFLSGVEAVNGFYDTTTGTIYISRTSSNPAMQVFFHELVHRMQMAARTDAKMDAALADLQHALSAVMDRSSTAGGASRLDVLFAHHRELSGGRMTDDVIWGEILADFVGEAALQRTFWARLEATSSFWGKIAEALRSMLARVARVFGAKGDRLNAVLSNWTDSSKDVSDAIVAAADAVEVFRKTNASKPAGDEQMPSGEVLPQINIEAVYDPESMEYQQFLNDLSAKARKQHEVITGLMGLADGMPAKKMKYLNGHTSRYEQHPMRTAVERPDFNHWVDTDAEWRSAVQSVRQYLMGVDPAIVDALMMDEDGHLATRDIDKTFHSPTSLMQNVLDSLPRQTAPTSITMPDGSEVQLPYSSSGTPMSTGAYLDYRMAMWREYNKAYDEGRIRAFSSEDKKASSHWGALDWLMNNSKTVMSGDNTTLCPNLMLCGGCFYCYRTATMVSGQQNKIVGRDIWYSGELLRLTESEIAEQNKLGGLRIQSFGDWMDGTQAQMAMIFADAKKIGLNVRIITKMPGLVEFVDSLIEQGVTDVNSVTVQISTDYVTEEIGGYLSAKAEKLRDVLEGEEFSGLQKVMTDRLLDSLLIDLDNPDALVPGEFGRGSNEAVADQFWLVHEGRWMGLRQWIDEIYPSLREAPDAQQRLRNALESLMFKRAMTIGRAYELASGWNERWKDQMSRPDDKWVAIRTVALTVDQAIDQIKDPRVDIVTTYHGNTVHAPLLIRDVRTGEVIGELESVGDAGLPRFSSENTIEMAWMAENDRDRHGRGKRGRVAPLQLEFAHKILAENIVRDYYRKVCCISGLAPKSAQGDCTHCTVRCAAHRLLRGATPASSVDSVQQALRIGEQNDAEAAAEQDRTDYYRAQHGVEDLRLYERLEVYDRDIEAMTRQGKQDSDAYRRAVAKRDAVLGELGSYAGRRVWTTGTPRPRPPQVYWQRRLDTPELDRWGRHDGTKIVDRSIVIRDDDGNVLPLYHGSIHGRAFGSDGFLIGRGIFATPAKNLASSYLTSPRAAVMDDEARQVDWGSMSMLQINKTLSQMGNMRIDVRLSANTDAVRPGLGHGDPKDLRDMAWFLEERGALAVPGSYFARPTVDVVTMTSGVALSYASDEEGGDEIYPAVSGPAVIRDAVRDNYPGLAQADVDAMGLEAGEFMRILVVPDGDAAKLAVVTRVDSSRGGVRSAITPFLTMDPQSLESAWNHDAQARRVAQATKHDGVRNAAYEILSNLPLDVLTMDPAVGMNILSRAVQEGDEGEQYSLGWEYAVLGAKGGVAEDYYDDIAYAAEAATRHGPEQDVLYQLIGKMANPLIVEGLGANWDMIPHPSDWQSDDLLKEAVSKYRDGWDWFTDGFDEVNNGIPLALASTNQIVADAKDMGHDGVIFRDITDYGGADPSGMESPEDVYVFMGEDYSVGGRSTQIKSLYANNGDYATDSPDIYAQLRDGTEARWYRKSESVLSTEMRQPMAADQMRSMLQKNGVSKDEIEWSGLADLDGTVTPQEAMDAIRQNAVTLEESLASDYGREPTDDDIEKMREQYAEGVVDDFRERYTVSVDHEATSEARSWLKVREYGEAEAEEEGVGEPGFYVIEAFGKEYAGPFDTDEEAQAAIAEAEPEKYSVYSEHFGDRVLGPYDNEEEAANALDVRAYDDARAEADGIAPADLVTDMATDMVADGLLLEYNRETQHYKFIEPGSDEYHELVMRVEIPGALVGEPDRQDRIGTLIVMPDTMVRAGEHRGVRLDRTQFLSRGVDDAAVSDRIRTLVSEWNEDHPDQPITEGEFGVFPQYAVNTDREPFETDHFDETDIVVHARITGRNVPMSSTRKHTENSRVLFIEEIQSDWHQAGRKKGYDPRRMTPDMQAKVDAAKQRLAEHPVSEAALRAEQDARVAELEGEGQSYSEAIDTVHKEFQERWEALHARRDRVQSELREITPGIPAGPFSGTWYRLALKRLIQWAVNDDYGYLAWTSGEMQSERYGKLLRGKFLRWTLRDNGEIGYGLGHVSAESTSISRNATREEFRAIVGQDISKQIEEKIAAGETEGVLSGDEMTIGSKGMIQFYNRTLPHAAGKLLKPFGIAVEPIQVELEPERTVLGFRLNNQIREAAANEHPNIHAMFQRKIRSEPIVDRSEGTAQLRTEAFHDRMSLPAITGANPVDLTRFLPPRPMTSASPRRLDVQGDPDTLAAGEPGGHEIDTGQMNFDMEGTSKPIAASEILEAIRHEFDVVIRGKATHPMRNAMGWYHLGEKGIRLRQATRLTTAMHEIGHFLDDHVTGRPKTDGELRRELFKLGKKLYGDNVPNGGYESEGWAEFIREWMTGGRATLQKEAPALLGWFEGDYMPENRRIARKLRKVRRMIQQFQTQGWRNYMRSYIRKGPFRGPLSRRMRNAALWLSTGFRDQFAPLRRALLDAGLTDLRPDEDPYALATFFSGKSPAVATRMVMDYTTDLAGNRTGKGLREILKPVSDQIDDFVAYMVSLRAINLAQAGRDPGMPLKIAERTIEEHDNDAWRRVVQEVTDWNHRLLDYVVEAGGLSRKGANLMRAANPVYLPFFRAFSDADKRARGRGTGDMTGKGRAVKKLSGTHREIIDPLVGMMQQAHRLISLAHKVAVARALVRLYDSKTAAQSNMVAQFMTEIPAPKAAVRFRAEQVKKDILRIAESHLGLDASEEGFLDEGYFDEWNEVLTVFVNAHRYTGAENVVSIADGEGGVRWFEVDKAMYRMLEGLDHPHLPKWLDIIAGKPARAIRLGATGLSASFGLIRNPIRDILTFTVFSEYAKGGPISALAGTAQEIGIHLQALGGKEVEDRFSALGLDLSGQLMHDQAGQQLARLDLLSSTLRGKAVRTLTHPLGSAIDAARSVFSITESGPRRAEFNAALRQASRMYGEGSLAASVLAGNAAQDVTVNFTRHGTVGKWLNQMIPFYNVAIQGPDKMLRAMRAHPVAFAAKAFTTLTVPALLAYFLYRDRDWWDELTPYERLNYLHFESGEEVVRVPVPFELGHVFQTLPVAWLDAHRREKGMDDLQDMLQMAFMQNTPDLLPPAAEIAWQVGTNRDYAGRPIVPDYQLHSLPDHLQRNHYTAETMVAISQMLHDAGIADVSPARMELVVNAFSGGLHRRLYRFYGNAAGLSSTETMSEMPVAGTLFMPDPDRPRNSISRLYERYDYLRKQKNGKIATPRERKEYSEVHRKVKQMSPLWKKLRDASSPEQRKDIYEKMDRILSR